MEIKKTNRGFAIAEFRDRNGVECSLQKSSLATEDCVWLGCNDLGLKQFIPGKGWQDITLSPHNTVANTRMHLTRDQARELITLLQRFVDTGELDAPEDETE